MAPRSLSLHNLLDMQPIAEEDQGEPASAAAPRSLESRLPGSSPGAAQPSEGFANGDVPGDPNGGGGGRDGGAGESRRSLASPGMLSCTWLTLKLKQCAPEHVSAGTRTARAYMHTQ